MKFKRIALFMLTGIVCFVLGFLCNDFFEKSTTKNQSIDIKSMNSSSIKDSDGKETSAIDSEEIDYSKKLKGKFILEGADYAGFDFVDSKTLTWTNELFPNMPDTMRLKWIDNNTFVGTFIDADGTDNAPGNMLNDVEYFDGHKLILKDIWTGQYDYKDDIKTFYKEEL